MRYGKRWKLVRRREVEMQNNDPYFEIGELKKKIDALKIVVDEVKAVVKPDEELWDGDDMVRYWGISPRLLADWRSKNLISYVQIGKKIFYPRAAREEVLEKHLVKSTIGETITISIPAI